MIDYEKIQIAAKNAGFDDCKVTTCEPLTQEAERYALWLDEGNHAGLHYLERNNDKRFAPAQLVEGARTVIVCAVGYKNALSGGYPASHDAKIASYACNRDYHTTIKAMLRQMAEELKREYPTLSGRAFVDSAPLNEKSLAVRAGVGWIGRQGLLISPTLGSWLHLGELVINLEADRYDVPFSGERCGSCRACVEACPNGAIREDRTIDARRCIACRTIERSEGESISLNGWLFGCDACQSCCPHNRPAPMARNPHFHPLFDPTSWNKTWWQNLTEEEFTERFAATPLVRCGLSWLQRDK